jgi:four helix bundle protein
MTRPELTERTDIFANEVEQFSRPLLDRVATSDTARQLRRAATGLASNYVSSGEGRSHDEFTSRLGVANDEAQESLYWLSYLKKTGLSKGPNLDSLLDESTQLARIFKAAFRTASANKKRRRSRRRQDRRK